MNIPTLVWDEGRGGGPYGWGCSFTDFRGLVGRGQEQGFKVHSDPGMAASPRLVSLGVTTCLECRKQVAREMGWFSQGGANLQWAGDLDVHGPRSLPSPQAISTRSCDTHLGRHRGIPPPLLSLPHPDRLGFGVRKLGTMNRDSGFNQKTSITHLGEPPCHLPHPAGLPAPHCVPSTQLWHLLIHSKHLQCPQVLGIWNPMRCCLCHWRLGFAGGGGWTQNLTTAGGMGLCGGNPGEWHDPALGQGSTGRGGQVLVGRTPPPDTSSLTDFTQATPAHHQGFPEGGDTWLKS